MEVCGRRTEEDNFNLASADAYAQIVSIIIQHRKASTGYIQRRVQIVYNRTASIMEYMAKKGIVGLARITKRICSPGLNHSPNRRVDFDHGCNGLTISAGRQNLQTLPRCLVLLC
jgi:DNA segregation ATPase FtsK/SpoIIIE-like protein